MKKKLEKGKFRYTYAYTASSYPNYKEICVLCDDGYSITFKSRKEMLKHLHEHVKAGHIVPEEEFEKYM